MIAKIYSQLGTQIESCPLFSNLLLALVIKVYAKLDINILMFCPILTDVLTACQIFSSELFGEPNFCPQLVSVSLKHQYLDVLQTSKLF